MVGSRLKPSCASCVANFSAFRIDHSLLYWDISNNLTTPAGGSESLGTWLDKIQPCCSCNMKSWRRKGATPERYLDRGRWTPEHTAEFSESFRRCSTTTAAPAVSHQASFSCFQYCFRYHVSHYIHCHMGSWLF